VPADFLVFPLIIAGSCRPTFHFRSHGRHQGRGRARREEGQNRQWPWPGGGGNAGRLRPSITTRWWGPRKNSKPATLTMSPSASRSRYRALARSWS